jgi:hypothetical protein
MPQLIDGPSTSLFRPVRLHSGETLASLREGRISTEMLARLPAAPQGACVCRGIPFETDGIVVSADAPVTVPLDGVTGRWIVFLHTSDVVPLTANAQGFFAPMRGEGQLMQLACTYRLRFADGTEASILVRRRHQVGAATRRWGENCFESVPHAKPRPVRPPHEQLRPSWGWSQTRVDSADFPELACWLYAWESSRPEVPITSLTVEPASGRLVLFGISVGTVAQNPLRWDTRRKAVLAHGTPWGFAFDLDEHGQLPGITLDLGQVISALPRPLYPDTGWEASANNQLPDVSSTEVLLEYTAHPDARFHLPGGREIPVAEVEAASSAPTAAQGIRSVPQTARRIILRVVEKGSGVPVPVKLHVHGASGEYLAPVDRHRIPNPAWYEDYSTDFAHRGAPGAFTGSPAERGEHGGWHWCTYISGETTIDLPLGTVFVEVSRGFEIRPARRRFTIDGGTDALTIELDRVLPWRKKGWVTADTHVHFLSPMTALLEGSAEGINVVNLLASQWGELMTNVGDFDGKTTWGSREAGGDGEHLVRVGTENRQHILGHISLLGYRGGIIAPMTTGGPDESALGDPVESLLSEWAEACRRQGGLVIVPHFPNPRAEHAAAIVGGQVDGIEMTSWGELYAGINPYSLSDWYRYLNCGYLVAAVGGTDKMSADTAVGTVRTYARIPDGREFTYDEWMQAVRRAETFVTYGPLLELAVDGKPMGSRIRMNPTGGTVEVTWKAQSVTVPMTRVDLVVNGEIRQSVTADPASAEGRWSLRVDRSSWAALLVRGRPAGRPEIVAAHSSPVMVEVAGTPFFAAADALTILDQIEGALAYLDTVGTRAQTAAYRRMRLVLESAHRQVHNRLHEAGHFHEHTALQDHPEHHR